MANDSSGPSGPSGPNRWKEYRRAIVEAASRRQWVDVYGDLEAQRPGSEGWVSCKCPLHADGAHNSFAFNSQNGSWKCFSGCGEGQSSPFDFIALRHSLDWKAAQKWLGDKLGIPRPVFKRISPDDPSARSKIVATYDYTDESGTVLFQVVRFEPKDFRQRRPIAFDPATGQPTEWTWKLGQVRRVLYRLPRVVSAIAAEEPIIIVEGEKDVHAAESLGFAATCNMGGADAGGRVSGREGLLGPGRTRTAGRKWLADYSAALAGAHIAIIPDNDDPGRTHAQSVARSLHGKAAALCIVTLPDMPPKGDLSDWVAAGGTREQLIDLIEAAPTWEAPVEPELPADGFPATTSPAPSSADLTPDANGLPYVYIRQELAPVTDEAQRALISNPSLTNLFVRSRMLVRVIRDGSTKPIKGFIRPPGAPIIEPVTIPALREMIDRSAKWVRQNLSTGRIESAIPPAWVAETLLHRGEWPFPYLSGVIESPTIRPDGTVLDSSGYDPDTGLLYEPISTFPPVPISPTLDDARRALLTLLDPFTDFPFVEPCDCAAVAASILTILARHAIEGCVPLFAFRAPTPSSGKSLCTDVVSIISAGRATARMSPVSDDNEMRKRIFAIGLEGAPVTLIDNIEGSLGSPSLAAVLTAESIKDRILGLSKNPTVEVRTVWLATGNGISFRGDLGRRVIPIDLDPHCEHPEDRNVFKYRDLIAHVRHSRPSLVSAGLTILRAYHLAGRPSHGSSRVGSFEAWDDLVRGACAWVGTDDPASGRSRIRAEGDADLDVLRAVFAALETAFGFAPFSTADAITKAYQSPELHHALLATTSARAGDKLNSRQISKYLSTRKGRIAGGRTVEKVREEHGGLSLWRVVHIERVDSKLNPGPLSGDFGDFGDFDSSLEGKSKTVKF